MAPDAQPPPLDTASHLTSVSHPAASLTAWSELFTYGSSRFDFIHVNSAGGPQSWHTNSGNGGVDAIPSTRPAIVSYVHSHSLCDPYDPDTIGGRWLHNGAYGFFGSIAESHTDANVPIFDVGDRAWKRSWPIGAAYRLMPMQKRWRPWKLMFFGDPLIRLQAESPKRVDNRSIPSQSIPLSEWNEANPFALTGADRTLLRAQCAAYSQRHQQTIERLAKSAQALDGAPVSVRRSAADLAAWACGDGAAKSQSITDPTHGALTLPRWLARLARAKITSPRLSSLFHELALRTLHEIEQEPRLPVRKMRLLELLRAHLAMPNSKAMYARIGTLYKPLITQLPDGAIVRRRGAQRSSRTNPRTTRATGIPEPILTDQRRTSRLRSSSEELRQVCAWLDVTPRLGPFKNHASSTAEQGHRIPLHVEHRALTDGDHHL